MLWYYHAIIIFILRLDYIECQFVKAIWRSKLRTNISSGHASNTIAKGMIFLKNKAMISLKNKILVYADS